MPAAKSMEIRREIVRRRQVGEAMTRIAGELGVAYGTVRNIWQRYQQQGQITPGYERCRHTAIRKGREVYEQAIALKRAHPSWGAGLIGVELADLFAEGALPSKRTLQRWFRRGGVGNVQRARAAKPSVKRGEEAHEVWAMDAKEQIQLGEGSYVSWLTITDEGSGAMLSASLFPPASLGER